MNKDIYKKSYDLICKEVLSYKFILAKILKYVLDEYEDCDEKEIIPLLGINTDEEKIICIQNAFGTHEYDLFFTTKLPKSINEIDLFINMEPQKTSDVSYQLQNRGIFYVGNEITYQYDRVFKNSKYNDLKKVVSSSFVGASKLIKIENSMMVLQLSKNMKIGYNSVIKKDYDKIQIIIIYLGQEDSHHPLLEFLKLIFRSDIQFEDKIKRLRTEYNVPISDSFEKEVRDMYGLSDLVEKRGIQIGIEQGKFEALLNAARNIMNKKNIDEYAAFELVGIEEKDYPIYLEALKEIIKMK